MTNSPDQTQATAKTDIQRRFSDLRCQDSARRTEVLQAISKETRPLFQALEAECGATGHRWKFHKHNYNYSVAWDKCVWCGASEQAEKHPGETINDR